MVWPEIGIFLLFLLAAQGLGGLLLPLAGSDLVARPDGPSRFLWVQALGLAGLLALAASLSFLELLRPWPIGLGLAGLAVLGLRRLGVDRPWAGFRPSRLTGWEKVLVGGLIFHQLVCLFQALAPPTSGEGLHYLFVLAREYVRAGEVHYYPDIYASRPQNMVLLFSLVQAFGRAEASQLISWWLGLLSVLTMIGWGGRIVGRRASLAGALIISSTPLFALISGRGMSDFGVLFFGLMGLWLISLTVKPDDRYRPAGMAGTFLGLAAGFKVVGVAAGLVGLVFLGLSRFQNKTGWGLVLVMGAALLAGGSPWYIYSHLHTGSALYHHGPISGVLSEADRTRIFTAAPPEPAAPARARPKTDPETRQSPGKPGPGVVGPVVEQDRIIKPLLRIRQFILGFFISSHNPIRNFWDLNLIADHRQRIGGVLILALVPVLLLLRPWPPGIKTTLLLAALYFGLCSLLFGPYSRYALTGLAIFALAAGWVWNAMLNLGRRAAGLATVILLLGWVIMLPEAGYALIKEFKVGVGLVARESYLDKATHDDTKLLRWANSNLGPNDRVLTIAEPRLYYLEIKAYQGSINRNPLLFGKNRSYPSNTRELTRFIRQMGITHIIISRRFSDNYWDTGDRNRSLILGWKRLTEEWLATNADEVFSTEGLSLHQIRTGAN